MTEENENKKRFYENDEQFKKDIRVSTYSVSLCNLFNISLEQDKTFVTISSAAIGLMFSVKKISDLMDTHQFLFFISVMAFLACIICTIRSFIVDTDLMASYASYAKNGECSTIDDNCKKIAFWRNISSWSLGLGITFFIVMMLWDKFGKTFICNL